MDHRDKDKQAVSDHELESCKEKMKRSLLGSCKAEIQSIAVNNSSSPTMRECDFCGKVFSSGKALGGHRRSHFQKHQKKVKVRFTNHSSKSGDNNNNRANCDYDDDDGKHVCCICKKEFPTKNALFGHMRSHPERSWRGVSPPTHHSHKNSSSSSYSYDYSSFSFPNSDSAEKNKEDHHHDDDNDDYYDCVGGGDKVIAPDELHHTDVIDLSNFTFPSWQKKDKRGRKCIGGYEAAETLAYLCAYAKYICGGSNRVFPKNDEVKPKSDLAIIKHEKRKIGESSASKKQEVKKIKFYLKGELKLENKTDGAGECDDGDKCKGLSESGVGRVSYMDDDDEEEVDVDEGFDDVNTEVITPSRVQEHNFDEKKNVKKMEKGKSGKKLVLKSKAKDTEYENNGSQEKVGGYKCGACGKIFSTFQGLGGHRSIHKEKNIVTLGESINHSDAVAEQSNSCSSSNVHKMNDALLIEEAAAAAEADEACQSSGTKKYDFDLNEMPSVMED